MENSSVQETQRLESGPYQRLAQPEDLSIRETHLDFTIEVSCIRGYKYEQL